MTMDLIIVGAGDSGKEIFSWANSYFSQWGYRFKGYLDDSNPSAFAAIRDYQPLATEVFICSIGSPQVRLQLAELLMSKGAKFINLIHPSAIIISPLTACGIVVAPFVYISNNVVLHNHVFLNVAATVGHDVTVGTGSVICAHCDLTGHVVLGERVFMGSHACIIPGKKIGDGATVAAGSMVMRNVPAGATVIGVPAKRVL